MDCEALQYGSPAGLQGKVAEKKHAMFDGSLDEGNFGGVEGLGGHDQVLVLVAVVDKIQKRTIFVVVLSGTVRGCWKMEWRRTSPYAISFFFFLIAAEIRRLRASHHECACKEEGAVMSIQNE